MADMLNFSVQDLASSFWNSAPPEIIEKIALLLNLGKFLAILIVIYFIIIIISRLLNWRDSFNISKIAKNTEEIKENIHLFVKSKRKK